MQNSKVVERLIMNEQKTLMTEGSIWKILIRFSVPLFLGNLFQQLYNAVDSLVVGNFCGNDALAAVSSSGSMCHLLIGFFQGVFMGSSVIISHRYGARDREGVDKAVHTTIWFSLVFGVVLTILGVIFTPTLLRWMGTPENVMVNSVVYFRIYCLGLLGLVLYNTTNGIFQALGDSKHPLYYLIISSIVNIVLDLLFVAVFDMGVAGAALATVMGQALSAVLGLIHLMSGKFLVKVDLKEIKPDFKLLKQILSLGLPSGVQNSVIAIANIVVQSNINAFGDLAMAGCGSYSKVQGFVFLPVTSLSMALTTFVGQNLGANKLERIKKSIKQGVVMGIVSAGLFGVFMFFCAPFFVEMFSEDPAVVAFGVQQARTESLFYGLLSFSHIAAAILRGAGKTTIPMFVMLGDWCVFRIIYITTLVRFIPDIRVVFSAYPLTWTISTIIFAYFLIKGDWLPKKAL